ncbi:MAG: GNAT family N-acetyltransferase [Pyrinomonadaceae bacterium]
MSFVSTKEKSSEKVIIRECLAIEEFQACVDLQTAAFNLSPAESSPLRHFIVSKRAGGWTLGAFKTDGDDALVGFVHHLVGLRETAQAREVIGYSHMMAVAPEFQNQGLGARLKWAQRERALREDVTFINWTWDPMQARNAHFNINRLGVVVSEYAQNFYGTNYLDCDPSDGLQSDRLFADWHLNSRRVNLISDGATPEINEKPVVTIQIHADWNQTKKDDPEFARSELLRVRLEFREALAKGLICAGFKRDETNPSYLFYKDQAISSADYTDEPR